MRLKEIEQLEEKYHGIKRALVDSFDKQTPLSVITVKPTKPISTCCLIRVLEEYRHIEGTQYGDEIETISYHVPYLYIIWQDGTIEKSDRIGYRCDGTTTDSWTGEVIHSGPMTEDEEVPPLCSHFLDRSDVKHVIVLEEYSRRYGTHTKTIEAVTLQIYVPHADTDIRVESQAIMEFWEEYGPGSLSDYLY